MSVISYSAEGASFRDRTTYPYFFRTIGENQQYEHVYLQLMQHLKWSRVAVLTEDGQKYTEYISHMETYLKEQSIELISNKKFPRYVTAEEMNRNLKELQQKNARIIIADVYDERSEVIMCEAYKLKVDVNLNTTSLISGDNNLIFCYIEHKFTFYIFRTMLANLQGTKILNTTRYEAIIDSQLLQYCFKTLNASFKGVVFHYTKPILYHNLMNRKNFTFRICKEVVYTNSFVFYFTKYFYLQSEFDNLMYRFDSAGLIERIMSKYIDPNSLSGIEKQPPSPLYYSNIEGIFDLLYFGCALALISFICEILLGYVKGRENLSSRTSNT